MDTPKVTQRASGPAGLPPGQVESRRPGRRDDVSPALLPLLRGTGQHLDQPSPNTADRPGAPLLGIVWGVALSVPLWGLIALVVWAIRT